LKVRFFPLCEEGGKMKKTFLVLIALALAFGLVWFGCEMEPSQVSGPETGIQQVGKVALPPIALERVMAIQNQHTPKFLEIPGVVGTATGFGPDDTPVILVFTKVPDVRGIPENIDGVPVVVKVTGEIIALARPVKPPKETIDPTARFDRPVPIGVSTGNEGECSAGTIGCRVTDGINVYALSNNHVYALENRASIDSRILQPGRYDTGCSIDENNVIGALSGFEVIKFDGTPNTIDAAIALSPAGNLGNATPSNGYGTPKSTPVQASIGQKVQKYGRSSSLTKGTVSGLNATVDVSYSSGIARFTGQIIVEAAKPFIKAGDSGSLLVTDPDRNPVGLLFAGNQTGKMAVANDINLVLTCFGVSIDGE
jgi:hypothetical protein